MLYRGIGKHGDFVCRFKTAPPEDRVAVQAQEMYPSRIALDQKGEQTINRDAKTTSKVS